MTAEKIRSALLVRLSSLGDIAKSLPIALLLARRGIRVGWVVEDRFARLLGFCAEPVEVHVWSRGIKSALAMRGVGAGFDAVLDIQANWKSGMIAALSGGERIYGAAREDVRERGNLLFTSRRARRAAGPHMMDRNLAVVSEALGEPLTRDALPREASLVPGAESLERARRDLAGLGIDVAEPVVAIVVGPPDDLRSWPLAYAEQLARTLPAQCVLVGGPAEAGLATDVPFLRHERGDPGDLVALGAVVADRGGVAVGHDGGAMHVLDATGASTVFLYGPQDPNRTGPLHQEVVLARMELPCRPCERRTCSLPEGPVCMTGIETDEVARRVMRCMRGS